MTASEVYNIIFSEKTIKDKEKDEKIEEHMKERGKLIINSLFHNNY
jgi:hypothetical protein